MPIYKYHTHTCIQRVVRKKQNNNFHMFMLGRANESILTPSYLILYLIEHKV